MHICFDAEQNVFIEWKFLLNIMLTFDVGAHGAVNLFTICTFVQCTCVLDIFIHLTMVIFDKPINNYQLMCWELRFTDIGGNYAMHNIVVLAWALNIDY